MGGVILPYTLGTESPTPESKMQADRIFQMYRFCAESFAPGQFLGEFESTQAAEEKLGWFFVHKVCKIIKV